MVRRRHNNESIGLSWFRVCEAKPASAKCRLTGPKCPVQHYGQPAPGMFPDVMVGSGGATHPEQRSRSVHGWSINSGRLTGHQGAEIWPISAKSGRIRLAFTLLPPDRLEGIYPNNRGIHVRPPSPPAETGNRSQATHRRLHMGFGWSTEATCISLQPTPTQQRADSGFSPTPDTRQWDSRSICIQTETGDRPTFHINYWEGGMIISPFTQTAPSRALILETRQSGQPPPGSSGSNSIASVPLTGRRTLSGRMLSSFAA